MAFTSGNDVNILQASDPSNVGAGAGDDKYIILAGNLMAVGQTITLSDTQGINTLQLIGGLTIVSSVFAANVAQLTLSDGRIVNINGADTFSYEIGGDLNTGVAGTIQNYNTFATTTLGAPSVPATGTVAGIPNTVIDPTPPPAYTLTASTTFVAEGSTATFTLTAATAPTTDQVFHLTLAGDTNGGTVGAASAADFATVPTTVTLAAGATTATFAVTPQANDGVEGIEGFKFNVLDPAGRAVGTGTPVVLITDTTTDTTAPVVTPPAAAFTYAENQATGYLVGTVVATDAVGVTGYSLDAATTTAGLFAIDAAGKITLTAAGAALTAASNDFETNPNTFTLGVTASDAAGNVSPAVNFTVNVTDVDDTAPKLVAATAATTTVKLNFDEALKPAILSGTAFSVVDAASANITVNSVTVSGTQVTLVLALTPSGAVKVSYTPPATGDKLQDAAGNAVAAIVNQAAVTDVTAPTLSSSTPADGVTTFPAADNLVLTFSENVVLGTGNITIVNAADATDTRTIAVTDAAQVSRAGAVVTINPTANLTAGASYYVNIPNTAVLDAAGNSYAGISNATDLNFSVVPASTSGQTFTLTTGVDTIPGLVGSAGNALTTGSDTIVGLQDTFANGGTYSAADVINGGDGTDTLNVTVVGASVATQVSGVEIINVRDTVPGSTFDASAITGATHFWSNNSTATADIFNLQNTATVGVRGGNGTQTVQFTFRDALIPNAATAGTQNIALDNADITTLSIGTATAGGNEMTTLAFDATGANRIRTNLVDSTAGLATALNATTAVTVAGGGSLRADEFALAATVKTVNASSNSGGVRFDLSATTTGLTVTGSSAGDRFVLAASLDTTDNINGAGGTTDVVAISDADTLTAATGALVTNFEVLEITAGDATAYTVSRLAGITGVQIDAVGAAVTTANQTLAQSTKIVGNAAAAAAVTLGFSNAGVGGTDLHTVILDANGTGVVLANGVDLGAALVANNVDTLTINSIGSPGDPANENSIATLAGNSDLNVISITGDTDLEITASGAIATDTVSASGFNGILQYFGQANTAAAAITGGSKADIIYGGAAVGDNIVGGAGGDVLIGGTGADVISGGAGNDYLIGDALAVDTAVGAFGLTYAAAAAADGAANAAIDRFVFDAALSASANVDRITVFTTTSDVIVLEDAIFTGIGVGTGNASAGGTALARYGESAVSVAAAVTASGLLSGSAILAVDSGADTNLFYIADVTAAATTAVQFATLIGVTVAAGVAAGDFLII